MEFVAAALSSITSAITGGAAAAGSAAGAATGAAGAAGAAAGGSTIASILSGGATALSILYGVAGANEKASSLELAARDAQGEQNTEQLQGLQRRSQIRSALAQAIGEQDTAYAASGVDLSFGTPSEARKAAVRDADSAVSIDGMTTLSRVSRLEERSKMLRAQARSTRRGALLQGAIQGLSYAADVKGRGGPRSAEIG